MGRGGRTLTTIAVGVLIAFWTPAFDTISVEASAPSPYVVGARLLFDAADVDGVHPSEVLVGGQVVGPVADGVDEVSVPISSSLLSSGENVVTIRSGREAPGRPYDEFTIRDVRLVLPDGTELRDHRYAPDAPLLVSGGQDGGVHPSRLRSSDAPIQVMQELPGKYLLSRDFRFTLPARRRQDGGSYTAQAPSAAVAGLATSFPLRSASGPTERSFGSTELTAVADADDRYVESTSEGRFPYHRFDVRVGAPHAIHLDVRWEGRTADGRGITLHAYDHVLDRWTPIGGAEGAEGDAVVRGTVDVATMVREGTVKLLVTEDPFSAEDTSFSVAWLTDTQYLSEGFGHIYDEMARWIVAERDRSKVAYVVHTGDIVQNHDATAEWERASRSQRIIEDAGIPNGVLPGNHDNAEGATHELYTRYFGEAHYKGRPWYAHSLRDNENHVDLVEAAGTKLAIIHLGFSIDDEEFAWANEMLRRHADRRAILAVHEYIDARAEYAGQGEEIWERVVRPNPNVFMVLAGHQGGVVHKTRIVGRRMVHEILSDYQFRREGGSGYLRLLRFDLDGQRVDVDTYSPYLDDHDDPDFDPALEDFTMPIRFSGATRAIATDSVAVSVPVPQVSASDP